MVGYAGMTIFSLSAAFAGERQPSLSTNEVAVDFPLDGGGMVMFSRMRSFSQVLQAGVVVGGGVIQRDFDLSVAGFPELEARTEALILPFIGPRLSLNFNFIGVSLAYGVFWAKTDFEATGPGTETFRGEKSGWGTALYSPLLVIDFLNKKRNIIFGFGLGGFLGTSYPDLKVASPAGVRLTTDESPLDTLTLHLRVLWPEGRRPAPPDNDEF